MTTAGEGEHGPLPALLLMLTVATGVVDAVSILALGRVFVANMTGNIVFIGFAAAGTPGFSLAASVAATAGFLGGAAAGGTLITHVVGHRGRLLRNAVGIESLVILAALLIEAGGHDGEGGLRGSIAAAALALAMGVQNAVVRRLAVPDLTTTVLTMTLTGLAADFSRGGRAVLVRRLSAIAAMLVGALVGALLVIRVNSMSALSLALALVVAALIGATFASGSHAAWSDAR
ncbi:MAG: DUF1275 domain-containing protein [Pseudonocardiales bacterium]|nr:DUF1275 domain-containing protein [Pseudonocardiales bacterium]